MNGNLRKLFRCALGAVAIALAGTLTARADEREAPAAAEPPAEKDWSFTAGFDLWSEYIFRGVDVTGNRPMLNPAATAEWKGFSIGYWGAYSDVKAAGWYEEADLTAGYSRSFFEDKLTLGAGYIFYWYPDAKSGHDTHEVYGTASLNVLLTPTVALYYDVDEIHGGYLTFGVSHNFDIGSKLGLGEGKLGIEPSAQLGIDLGYNSRASRSDVQFNDVLLGIKVPWQITDNFEVHAAFQVSVALEALNDIGQHNERIGNVGFSYSF
jgi:uncharacterized protein (TIGR02001 family)